MHVFKVSPFGYQGFNSLVKTLRKKFSRFRNGAYGASDSDIAEHQASQQ